VFFHIPILHEIAGQARNDGSVEYSVGVKCIPRFYYISTYCLKVFREAIKPGLSIVVEQPFHFKEVVVPRYVCQTNKISMHGGNPFPFSI
ncbi:MAG: hypothetical protein FWH57_09915, partial [Oscillospiraceae bacterium]|nr:hypothetical protein [Oscillospiraceae bacterium]